MNGGHKWLSGRGVAKDHRSWFSSKSGSRGVLVERCVSGGTECEHGGEDPAQWFEPLVRLGASRALAGARNGP